MKKTTLKQKIALIILGIFLCVFLLEIGLRIGGFVFLSIQDHRNKISLKHKGAYRIMCLGESTTAGQWPRFLEDYLNQKDIGIKFSVIDNGVPGINTEIIVSLLEGNLDKYNPQMVIAMMGINDDGTVIPYEDIPDKRVLLFFKSFRIYKLTKLLRLHIINKLREMRAQILKEKEGDFVDIDDIVQPSSHPTQKQITEKSVEINPNDEQGYIELGLSYRDTGELHKSKEMFSKAVEINPNDEQGYIELGLSYRVTGDHDKAKEMFSKAIEINPNNDQGYFWMGWCYRDAEEDNKSKEMFEKAVEINPINEQGYLELVRIYRRLGEPHKAIEILKKAVEINPKNEKLNAALAIFYKEEDKYSLADEYSRKAESIRVGGYDSITHHNYKRLKEIIVKRGIMFVCVQYPTCNTEQLKRLFEEKKDIVFVDNEKLFKERVAEEGYDAYFVDMFAGDFGHCTEKGNRLLAENIANTIIKKDQL